MLQQNNGFDKNQLISFAVFTFLMMGFLYYFQNQQVKEAELQKKQQTEQVAQKSQTPKPADNQTIAIDSAAASLPVQKVYLKNNELALEFSSKGGQISSVEILTYKAFNKTTQKTDKQLFLFKDGNSDYGLRFTDNSGKTLNTKDLVFSPSVSGNSVTMTADAGGGAVIRFIYTLLPKYTVDFQVKTQGISNQNSDFIWDYKVREAEKGRSQEQQHTEFSYAFKNYKDYDYDARTTMNEPEETLNWLGVKQQFFVALIEAQNGFTDSKGNQDLIEKGEFLKKFNFDGKISNLNQNFKWYFLPLDLKILKSYEGKNFDEILPLGWSFIGTMNRWLLIPMYNGLKSLGWFGAGWIIFLMTIIIKIVLSPIMFRQHKLSAMMKVLRPEIDEVNEKYKNADPMKKQQEVMAVYRKAGVNQLAGCIPALLQIPIFYSLFRFFPNMIDLRGKSFWFAKDLTAYDDLIKLPDWIPLMDGHLSIFGIACTAVILIYTVMTAGNIQQPQQEGMPNMKIMMYIFPVTFMFFLNSAASGLSWYYFVSNAINIVIILVIQHVILDEKKIHAQIQANKAQPKKEGKFSKRMRELMEQAQEQQKLQEQRKKRK